MYVTRSDLSAHDCSHQTHVGQPGHANTPRHAQSVMGPECSNYHKGSGLCNIANGHPINSAQRVLNNTEVKERNTICRHACFGVYASSVQLCNTSKYVTRSNNNLILKVIHRYTVFHAFKTIIGRYYSGLFACANKFNGLLSGCIIRACV